MQFQIRDGTPLLLREADRETLAGYGRRYREAREQEGWLSLTRDQALALPFRTPPGASELYWSVRRASYRRLMRYLAQEGPSLADGPVADLGAGIGWLSFRLALAGYKVLAVDASLDDAFGLGAAVSYLAAAGERLLFAQGNLEHPPLYVARWSLVVYNASLHYAHDLEATLARAASALLPRGRIVVLDTPVARRPVPGTGRGDRHLGQRELEDALAGAGLSSRWLKVWRGPRWWVYRLKAWLRGSAPFSFPIVVGELERAGPPE
jgi:SAM-dependent methyltransferase